MIETLGALYSEAYGLVNAVLIRLWLPLQICLVYFCLEAIFPRSRNSFGSYLRAASFVAVSIAINLVPMNLATTLLGADQRKPLAILDMTPLTESPNLAVRAVGWVLAVYAIAFIGHVTYYWFHRAQHAIPWMWRLHKVHHSIREMSATSSYHHVTEDVLQYACTVVPMSFLLGVERGRFRGWCWRWWGRKPTSSTPRRGWASGRCATSWATTPSTASTIRWSRSTSTRTSARPRRCGTSCSARPISRRAANGRRSALPTRRRRRACASTC